MWLLCLMCVTAPAWGSEGEDAGVPEPESREDVIMDLGWDEDRADKVWKEACAFAPGGELWRFSGTSQGSSTSSGVEYFALRREGQKVLHFGQEGDWEFGGGSTIEESEQWKVRCEPGRLEIVTPAVQISMQVGDSELQLDPRFSRLLRPGSCEFKAPALQTLEEVFDSIASSMGLDSPNGQWREGLCQVSGLGEALTRARLLSAERLLAASDLDSARGRLGALPEGAYVPPEVSSWAADLRRRLEGLQSKPPLMATGARRVGAIMSLPGLLHEEDDPVLFWRGTQLCVRQEASEPPRMRCVEAATGSWGKEEPYRSPFGGWHVELEYQGALGYYRTTVTTDGPGGSTEYPSGYGDDWYSPVVVARGRGPRLAVMSATDPMKNSRKEKWNLTSGPVSLLAGGGRYCFSRPDTLRSLEVAGQSWKFVVPLNGKEVRCAAPPRVSPNGRWAACPAAPAVAEDNPDAKPPSRFDLLVFGLTPRAP
jgi:hypothetical protein